MIFSLNKKGTVQDLFFIVGISLAFITTVFVAMKIFGGLQGSLIYTSSPTALEVQADSNRLNNLWDGIFVMVFVLGAVSAVIAAFLSGAHPIFFWSSLILGMLLIIVGVVANNYVDSVLTNDSMSDVKALLPKTIFIFDNFGRFLTAFIMMVCIALYFPTREGLG